ncbi:MAG: apolipoprotein N-acyltransferase [Myxococcales bacterium]|nr:apolipoprotein N-acyltransferase [Myxococcales bacterium]
MLLPRETMSVDDNWKPEKVFGTRAAVLLATLTGVLFPIAFVGIGVWPVGFIAWVPLLLALRGQTPRLALKLGLWSGFLAVMIGFSWLTQMLSTFSGFPLPVCVAFASIVSFYQGGSIGLLAYAYARATERGWHRGLSFAGAFALSELVYPLLFPWYFAAGFHEIPILLQTADLGGPILASLVFVGVNIAIAEVVAEAAKRWRACRRSIAVGLAIFALALIYGDLRIRAIDARIARAEPVKIGLVQSHIGLLDRKRAVKDSLALSKAARDQGAELLVWSEATIPGAFDVATHQRGLEKVTKEIGAAAVVGGVLYERLEQTGPKGRRARYFNSAFIADASGKILGRYDKQFLLMFGEYLPLGELLPILYEWSPNSGAFTAGTSFEPLRLGTHRIATTICYEDIIPSFVNKLVRAGDPDLLVNLTNDRWFQNEAAADGVTPDTAEPWQHYALAKFRSIEHRMFLARVSNSGVSGIIDPVGRVVVQGGTMKREALVGEARYMRVATVYSVIGNAPWWATSAMTLVTCFMRRRRPRA